MYIYLYIYIYVCMYVYIIYVTGFRKTDPNSTFGISRTTNLKYLPTVNLFC